MLSENIVGKGEIAHFEQFHLFPQCFLHNLCLLLATCQLSSAASLNLGQSQNSVLGNRLKKKTRLGIFYRNSLKIMSRPFNRSLHLTFSLVFEFHWRFHRNNDNFTLVAKDTAMSRKRKFRLEAILIHTWLEVGTKSEEFRRVGEYWPNTPLL